MAPRRATDGFERVDALESARRALAKARLFGGESVRERAVPLEAPGAKKKPSNAFNTSDDDAEHEQRREGGGSRGCSLEPTACLRRGRCDEELVLCARYSAFIYARNDGVLHPVNTMGCFTPSSRKV